jgi:transcriptional regulator with XRE-family HTH domain
MKDQLNLFLKNESLTPTELSDALDIQRSGLSHILSGRNNPGYDFIKKFAEKFPYVNLQWLITGKGDIYINENTSSNTLFPINNQEVTRDFQSKQPPESSINKPNPSPQAEKRILIKTILIYSDNSFEEYTPR